MARNIHDENFSDIGKQLRLTQRKAQAIYCHYYHKKVMKAIRIIEPNVDFDFSKYIYDSSVSSYQQWQLIASEYPDMVQDLMD